MKSQRGTITNLLVCVLCLFVALQSHLQAQTPKRDPLETLRQLLNLPAPRPPNTDQQSTAKYPPAFFDKNNPPPDDAPLSDLVTYFSRWAYRPEVVPSDTVRQRLFEFCLDEPKYFVNFANLVPQTKAAAIKIKEVYDKAELEDHERGYIKNWLIFNSDFFVDELLELVKDVKENERNGSVDNAHALIALARVKWEVAEPLLRNMAAAAQPRSGALAQSLFYLHAIGEKDSTAEEQYRKILKTIASNRDLPPYARDVAIEKLSLTEWAGRDEWYLALFQDETLIEPSDSGHSVSPLTTLCGSNPDKWIPVMARLVESKDLVTRGAAAKCLISFSDKPAAKEALTPLLPWLSNPTWISEKFKTGRMRLMHCMGEVEIPESVPGLIWVVENDDGDSGSNRSVAAQSLVKYKDPRAAPALKRALAKEKLESQRKNILAGLIASQGLSDAEQLEAVEAYASQLTSAETRAEVERYRNADDEQLPMPIVIGEYLGNLEVVPEPLVQAVLARAETLKSDNVALATALLEVAHRWQGRQVELDMITRIGNGSADSNIIDQALKRSATMRQNLTPQLQALVSGSGMAPGVGAVLLDNPSLAQDVLTSKDQIAQIALLACSRLTNTRLPVELVGPLLRGKNELLALAAERYLLLEDSREARDLLWQYHPNKAFITGWGENAEAVFENFKPARELEEKLRAELLKDNGPVEVISLIGSVTDTNDRVLRIFSDKAIYTHYEDSARYRERVVSNAELASFKQFLKTKDYADLGPQFQGCQHNNCEQFLTMTREKGRRVYAQQAWETWADLRENLDLLGEGAGTKAVRVSDDNGSVYTNPIATGDGKWVVVVKRDGSWTSPSYIVRFNVRTGREFRFNLEPADELNLIALVVPQGKVLLRRAKNQFSTPKRAVGPDRPEHYLLDPSTGNARLVTGEFTPLYEKRKRFLQPTDQPNEFWAAISDDNKRQTQVGPYNVKDFTFKPLLTVPHISFESSSMFVDERQKKLYVVYEGQLLRLPLP